MKGLKLVLSKDVRQLIDEQVLYIAKHSVDNALAWDERLRTAINRLVDSPGHAIDEDASERVGYVVRKLTFDDTYLIFYVVNDQDGILEVVHFRHGARRPGPNEP